MTRNITSMQWSNNDPAILGKANPLRNCMHLGIQTCQLQRLTYVIVRAEKVSAHSILFLYLLERNN